LGEGEFRRFWAILGDFSVGAGHLGDAVGTFLGIAILCELNRSLEWLFDCLSRAPVAWYKYLSSKDEKYMWTIP
jgi:hypothetical protein